MSVDTVVTPSWITELVEVMRDDASIGIAQSKLVSMNRSCLDSLGGALNVEGYGKILGYGMRDCRDQQPFEVMTVSGAAFMCNKKLFNYIGLFDDSYFMYYEDTDLCLRTWLAGYRVVSVPASVVYHMRDGIASEEMSRKRQLFLYTRNRLATLFKNYELHNMLRYVFLISLIRMPWFFYRAFKLKNLSEIKGLLCFLLNLKIFAERRAHVQSLRRKTDDYIFKKMANLYLLRAS